MTSDQVIDLLTLMATFDRRTVGEADVASWGLAVGDLEFADAAQAVVAHYRAHTAWAMPAHVRDGVAQIHAARLAQVQDGPPPDHLRDDPAGQIAWLRERRAAIASGEVTVAPVAQIGGRR